MKQGVLEKLRRMGGAEEGGRAVARLLPFYVLGFLIAFGLKSFYSRAGADELNWILQPTCALAGRLAGIHFERELRTGWISHEQHFIVGPGCAGLNFLIIAFSALFFSFLHRLRGGWARAAWLGGSLPAAILLTIATNSLRIVAAIRLYSMDIYGGFVTPHRVHCAEGAAVYCLSLLLAALAADRLSAPLASPQARRRISSVLVPIGWYLGLTVGVPLANRAYRQDAADFLEHSLLVVSIAAVMALAALALRRVPARMTRRGASTPP